MNIELAPFFMASGLIFSLFARAGRRLSWALVVTLLLAVFVHPEATSTSLGVHLITVVAINVLAWLRSGESLQLPGVWICLFIVAFSWPYFARVSDFIGLAYALLGFLALFCTAVTARTLGHRLSGALYRVALISSPALLLGSLSELFLGWNALWPRRDGTTYRIEGVNNLLPWVDGRAMVGTGYAITLGLICAVLAVVAFHQFLSTRSKLALLVALTLGAVVLFSGTRSALIGLLMALIALLVLHRRLLWLMFPLFLIGVGGVVLLVSVGFSDDLQNSQSFVHRIRLFVGVDSLLSRSPERILFGDGFAGVEHLFLSGQISGAAGVLVLDNDYLRLFVSLGAIGLAVFAAACLMAMLRAPLVAKAGLIVVLVGAAFYDLTTWRALFLFLVVLLAARDSLRGVSVNAAKSFRARTLETARFPTPVSARSESR